jgi:serine/threonine protein kinase
VYFAKHRDDSYWNAQKYPNLSNELKELLSLMFQRNPITRPTFAEIKSHKWMKGFYTPTNDEIKSIFDNTLTTNQIPLKEF